MNYALQIAHELKSAEGERRKRNKNEEKTKNIFKNKSAEDNMLSKILSSIVKLRHLACLRFKSCT